MDLLESLEILDSYYKHLPQGASGFDLDHGEFVKLVNNVYFYFYFPVDTWKKDNKSKVRNNILPIDSELIPIMLNGIKKPCRSVAGKKAFALSQIELIRVMSLI